MSRYSPDLNPAHVEVMGNRIQGPGEVILATKDWTVLARRQTPTVGAAVLMARDISRRTGAHFEVPRPLSLDGDHF